MKKHTLLIVFVFACLPAFAQYAPYQLDPPAPSAQMRICVWPGNGNPCSNTAVFYQDVAGNNTLANPINLSTSGNITFYGSPGIYTVQLSGGSVGYREFILVLNAISYGGSNNLSIGVAACSMSGQSGQSDTCVGHAAGHGLTSGNNNTFTGDAAASNVSTGSSNTCIGANTCGGVTTQINNVAIGASALFQAGTNDTTAVGQGALSNSTCSGSCGLTYVGKDSGNGQGSGQFNTGVGQDVLLGTTGPGCSAGTATAYSGSDNTGLGQGSMCTISGAASDNTVIGFQAGVPSTGVFTGNNNLIAGSQAAQGNGATITGSNNTILGFQANFTGNAPSRRIAIGAGASGNEDNKAVLGDSNVTALSIGGNFGFSKPGGTVFCGSGAAGDTSCTFQAAQLQTGTNAGIFDPHFVVTASGDFAFTNAGNYTGSRDANISRCGVGCVGFGNGTVGDTTAEVRASTHRGKRISGGLGTAQVAGNIAISGWGTGAAVSAVSGQDMSTTWTVTSGTTPSANPTVTVTFADGTWTTAPGCLALQTGGNDIVGDITITLSATAPVLTWNATPTNAKTYIFTMNCTGRQ